MELILPMRGRRKSSVSPARPLAVVLAAAVLIPASLAAQATVRSAHMRADLVPDDGAAEVRIDYVLDVEGVAPLRFELLGFRDATAEGFWLGERETGTPMMLDYETGTMRAGDFTLNIGPGPTWSFTARYLVPDAVERVGDEVRVNVPVLAVAVPPAQGAGDVFTAEVFLPRGWEVAETFPNGLTADEDGVYMGGLAVLPSVIRMRAGAGGPASPGLPLVADLIAGGVLLLFGGFGLRHLRSVVR